MTAPKINWSDTLFVWKFGLFKVPLIFLCLPRVVELSEKRIEIILKLNWLTKNHLNSMYFGALAIGADCAGGLLAMKLTFGKDKKISFVFKDLKADFKKRCQGDVHFICNEGENVKSFVARVLQSSERQEQAVQVFAKTPAITGEEVCASFLLTMSARSRSSKA